MPTNQENNKIRVLFISARADHGGGPKHMRDLINGLKRPNSIDTFVASPTTEPYGPEFSRLATKFIEIPHRGFSFLAAFRILKLVRNERINIVHSHGRGAGLYSRLIGLFTETAVVHTFHGVHAPTGFRSRVGFWIDQILANVKMTAIFVSKNERASAEKFGFIQKTTRVEVIENGVDLDLFRLRRLGLPSEKKPTCGIFLRDDEAKGPDLFLALVQSLSESKTDLVWTCAGISRSELSKWGKIPANLKIVDRVENPQDWLQSVDFYLSTSRSEGQPLGVLEAMASGALCFLSEIPAHEKFLKAGAAIPLRLNSPKDLDRDLESLAGDPTRYSEIQRKARTLVERDHSLTGMTEKIKDLYEVLVSFPKKAPSNK